ncbi:glutaredoxin 3 [Parvularcula marina]|uniref:Glutaredoxin n=1 Tax=Parvularcula marina TaxID=2292771 RepID=A0A371RKX6_9PROT|nr:glutaredoxin 3 [Parvularcula marina]RFB06109.1 glutaredoxin 3 [Parvularcula marina]
MKPVTIYTTMMCPYCTRAKKLLEEKGAEYEEIRAGLNTDLKAEMIQRSGGARTFPQVFIGDTHVGGSDELAALEREGKLDALLAD